MRCVFSFYKVVFREACLENRYMKFKIAIATYIYFGMRICTIKYRISNMFLYICSLCWLWYVPQMHCFKWHM